MRLRICDTSSKLHYTIRILNEYASLKLVVSKFSKHPIPWITPALLQAIREKIKLKDPQISLLALLILLYIKSLRTS